MGKFTPERFFYTDGVCNKKISGMKDTFHSLCQISPNMEQTAELFIMSKKIFVKLDLDETQRKEKVQ